MAKITRDMAIAEARRALAAAFGDDRAAEILLALLQLRDPDRGEVGQAQGVIRRAITARVQMVAQGVAATAANAQVEDVSLQEAEALQEAVEGELDGTATASEMLGTGWGEEIEALYEQGSLNDEELSQLAAMAHKLYRRALRRAVGLS
jgi:hypothetical protein